MNDFSMLSGRGQCTMLRTHRLCNLKVRTVPSGQPKGENRV